MDATSSYLNRNRLSPLERQMQEALKRAQADLREAADKCHVVACNHPRNNRYQAQDAECLIRTGVQCQVGLDVITAALAAADRAASSSTEE